MPSMRLACGSRLEAAAVVTPTGGALRSSRRGAGIMLAVMAAAAVVAAVGLLAPAPAPASLEDPWASVLGTHGGDDWDHTADLSSPDEAHDGLQPLPAYNPNDGSAERDELSMPNLDDNYEAKTSALSSWHVHPAKLAEARHVEHELDAQRQKAARKSRTGDLYFTNVRHMNPDVEALQAVRNKILQRDKKRQRQTKEEEKQVFARAAREESELTGKKHAVHVQAAAKKAGAVPPKSRRQIADKAFMQDPRKMAAQWAKSAFAKKHPILARLEKKNEMQAEEKIEAEAKAKAKAAEKAESAAKAPHKAAHDVHAAKVPKPVLKKVEGQVSQVLHKIAAQQHTQRHVEVVDAAGYHAGQVRQAKAQVKAIEQKQAQEKAELQAAKVELQVLKERKAKQAAQLAALKAHEAAAHKKALTEQAQKRNALQAEMAKVKREEAAKLAALSKRLDSVNEEGAGHGPESAHTGAVGHAVEAKAPAREEQLAAFAGATKEMAALAADENADDTALDIGRTAKGVDLTHTVRLPKTAVYANRRR